LALRIRCCKGLIVFHKVNGLTTMKNDLDVEHKAIYVKYSKEAFKHSKGPLKWTLTIKRALYKMLSRGFLLHKSFLKEPETQKEFLEDLMFFMIKGYMSLRTIKSIWLHYLHTCCVLGLSFHLGKFLWKKFYLPWCWKYYKPCATYFKWMYFNHLHLWPLDIKSCTWYVHHCARFLIQ
jgi:hypothetical protein